MALGEIPGGEAVGAVLNGQWRLIRLIGEGGLAAVYEADGLHGQGKRAIKLLHPQFQSQPEIVERFYAEAQACFSLRHPHIAKVEAYAYAEDGSPYIVMELLLGMGLDDYLHKHPPLAAEQAAPILYGVLQALSVAHAGGIVHRDLKPANLFLVSTGAGEQTVKVLDFGIAKVMDLAGGMGSKTRTGAILGTPGYMSPEQVKNSKAVDARTDLWAAGVVLYEMLCHQHPFGEADQLSRMVAVLRDPPTPISKHAPALAFWDPFFERALAREADKRFQSAEEMAEQLRQVVQGVAGRFVPDGMQTVAIPLLPDMRADLPASPPGAIPAEPTAPAPHGVPYHLGPQPVVVPAPPAGSAYGGASKTVLSADKPAGTPTIASNPPNINVIMAAPERPVQWVWWAVLLVAFGCFASGLLMGYWLGIS